MTTQVTAAMLRERLEALTLRSEEIYLSLGKNLPLLVRELDRGFEEPKRVIAYFRDRIDVERDGVRFGQTAKIIEDAHSLVREVTEFFAAMGKRDQEMSAALAESMERLTRLAPEIDRIRESSMEMELISLNAMVTAIKAGFSGRAFSYITDELKRLSTRTIEATEMITKEGRSTIERFAAFRTTLAKAQDFQRLFYEDFAEKLRGGFQRYQEGVRAIAEYLGEITDRARGVREPLLKIMEGVQLQDIIKQSVAHVLIALGELRDGEVDGGAEEQLDEHSFREQIAELCMSVLEDVRAKSDASLAVFTSNLAEMRTLLERVERDRLAFIRTTMPTGGGAAPAGRPMNAAPSGSEGSLNRLFSESTAVLTELLGNIDQAKRSKIEITTETREIVHELSVLEESFAQFASVISQFYPIKVLSQLEVAKQKLLEKGGETVEEMTSLSDRINTDMSRALEIIRDVMERSNDSLRTYAATAERELATVERMTSRIAESNRRFLDLKQSMSSSLADFSIYSASFLSQFAVAEQDVARLRELIAEIDSVKGALERTRADALEHKRGLLGELKMAEWRIKSDRIRAMIERFTLVAHKRAAGTIAGFEVESGSAEGELTYFQ